MATNTAGGYGRQNVTQQTGYLRKAFTYANAGQTLTLGYLPPGAIVINAGVVVSTAFDGTSPVLDLGTAADPDGFATDLDLTVVGRTAADEMATSNDLGPYTTDTQLVAVPAIGGSPTAGAGVAYVEYLCNNDG